MLADSRYCFKSDQELAAIWNQGNLSVEDELRRRGYPTRENGEPRGLYFYTDGSFDDEPSYRNGGPA